MVVVVVVVAVVVVIVVPAACVALCYSSIGSRGGSLSSLGDHEHHSKMN